MNPIRRELLNGLFVMVVASLMGTAVAAFQVNFNVQLWVLILMGIAIAVSGYVIFEITLGVMVASAESTRHREEEWLKRVGNPARLELGVGVGCCGHGHAGRGRHGHETGQRSYDHAEYYKKMAEQAVALGDYRMSLADLDKRIEKGAVMVGDPDDCLKVAKFYESAGTDLLLMLVQVGAVPHEKVMQTIDLIGKHVMPKLSPSTKTFQMEAAATAAAAGAR